MFDKALLTEETRKNAKELLEYSKNVFRLAHASMGFDLTKHFDVVKIEGSFTHNIVKKLIRSCCDDDYNAIIYTAIRNGIEVKYAFVDDCGFNISLCKAKYDHDDYRVPYRGYRSHAINYLRAYSTKGGLERTRKDNVNISYIVIQPRRNETAISPAFRRDGYHESGYCGCFLADKIELANGEILDCRNVRYRVFKKNPNAEHEYSKKEYRLDGLPYSHDINNVDMNRQIECGNIDKSGYFRKNIIDNYTLRVISLVEAREKEKVDSFDFNEKVNELKDRVTSLLARSNVSLQKYYDTILTADDKKFEKDYVSNHVSYERKYLHISSPINVYTLSANVDDMLKGYRKFVYDVSNKNHKNLDFADQDYKLIFDKIQRIETLITELNEWTDEMTAT